MDFMIDDMNYSEGESFNEDWTNEEVTEDESDSYEDDDFYSSESDEGYSSQEENIPMSEDDSSFNDTNGSNDDAEEQSSTKKRNYSPSFTGLGKCKCGCASFVGCGSWCDACGHSYKAHGSL